MGYDVTTLGARKPNRSEYDTRIGYKQVPLPFLRKVANRILSKPRYLFQNRQMWHLFKRFDQEVAQIILNSEPRYTVLCTSMAEISLKASQSVGAKSILLQGSSPLQFFEKYMIEANDPNPQIGKSWKRKQEMEILSANIVVVESSFVKRDCQKLGARPDQICVIPPHIKKTHRSNVPLPTPVTFGTIQLGFGKGTEKLIQWWSSCLQIDSSLFLVGKIDPFWKKRIFKAHARIQCFGYLQGEAWDRMLKSISVAIFPTYSDGGPRSLFECMAYGHCPIV